MSALSSSTGLSASNSFVYRKLSGSVQEKSREPSRVGVVKSVCKAAITDSGRELERLVESGVIDSTTASRVQKHLNRYGPKKEILQAVLGRALGIQGLYRDSHDIFVHGQMSAWRVHSDLIKELMKLNHPGEDFHQFRFLRPPEENIEYGIERYSQSADTNDNSLQTNNDLLSVDSYLYNREDLESALCFLSTNSSCNFDSCAAVETQCRRVLSTFYPKMPESDLARYASRITESYKKEAEAIGTLLVFCIPKEVSDQVQHRSHAFGKPCTCHSERNDREILEEMKKGDLNETNECVYANGREFVHAPQARIFIPALNKKDGIEIYQLVSDKEKRKTEKAKVREIASEVHERFRPTQAPQCVIL